ncbi:integrin beta-5-like isoform X2 [Ostrea edulis]|nr:integrin beta-5-like isoform X2 [Ostrea edulis]
MRIILTITVLALAGLAVASVRKRQTNQCTTAADCTCSDDKVAECHHGHCTCHHDSGHHPRALCHHGHLCTCQNGETGLCDQHGHCHCIHGRALCHHGHLCTCQNGETGICDQHGHCHCIHG